VVSGVLAQLARPTDTPERRRMNDKRRTTPHPATATQKAWRNDAVEKQPVRDSAHRYPVKVIAEFAMVELSAIEAVLKSRIAHREV